MAQTQKKPATKPAAQPAEDVTLNLDELERENTYGPFTFLHNGHRYTMADPHEMDWQEQLRCLMDPIYFLRRCLSAEDQEAFFTTEMPSWKLEAVIKAYRKHYAIPSPGESDGSPT